MATVPGPAGLVQALTRAATLQFQSGHPERAEGFVRLLKKGLAEPGRVWEEAGCLHFDSGEFEEAGRAFGYAAAHRPQDAGLQARLARVCYRLSDLPQCEGYLRRALALDADDPLALEFVAEVNRDFGDPALAADVFIRLLRRFPHRTHYSRSLERCWARLGVAATASSLVGPGLDVSRFSPGASVGAPK